MASFVTLYLLWGTSDILSVCLLSAVLQYWEIHHVITQSHVIWIVTIIVQHVILRLRHNTPYNNVCGIEMLCRTFTQITHSKMMNTKTEIQGLLLWRNRRSWHRIMIIMSGLYACRPDIYDICQDQHDKAIYDWYKLFCHIVVPKMLSYISCTHLLLRLKHGKHG